MPEKQVPPHHQAYAYAKAAVEQIDSGKKSAELTLAKRKLQEANFWMEEHERQNEGR